MLIKLFCLLLLLLVIPTAYGAVTSCDEAYRIESRTQGRPVLVSLTGSTTLRNIKHEVAGGNFSADNTYVVLYGPPLKADRRSPQATLLTLYEINRRTRFLGTASYGSGIYSARFTEDAKYVEVDTAYGIDIIDTRTMQHQFHDPGYEPDFPLHDCAKRGASQ
ncbi:hypothetical protein [Paraburkholderia bannensis]|uniref:hypothetical protein n=1 Tax=Paraburkholderia bannensis TaxID=765414 RepID=UPI002AC35BD9|nr:hypothetical protein [Paraburkholderia bannensis]